jgi:hypothetical protein
VRPVSANNDNTDCVMARTCWRGVEIEHPAAWEISVAIAPGEDGRLTYVDRRYTRLDMRWRTLKYVPDLNDMLERFRREAGKVDDGMEIVPLKNAPHPWAGFQRRGKQGSVVHATRFFKDQRLLVELVIVWPKTRHREVEKHILESVALSAEGGKTSYWRALGLEVDAPAEFRLTDNNAKVGRVSWTFVGPNEKRPQQLVVERLAMPDQWLAKPLEEWLQDELPPRSRVVEEKRQLFNGHDARRLLSETKIGTLSALIGWRRVRLDVAWRCDRDGRLYRVSYSEVLKKGQPVEFPSTFRVACCQRPPVVDDDVEL